SFKKILISLVINFSMQRTSVFCGFCLASKFFMEILSLYFIRKLLSASSANTKKDSTIAPCSATEKEYNCRVFAMVFSMFLVLFGRFGVRYLRLSKDYF